MPLLTRRLLAVLCGLSAPALGCVGAGRLAAPPPLGGATAAPTTTLGIDDVFEMKVYGEQEMSGTYRVAADGSVSVPLCGPVSVLALSPAAAAAAVEARLGTYLQQPHVSIFVKEYNSKKVSVFGEVKQPGTFAYTPGMNIVQAVTLAGGFDRLADKSGALVTRLEGGRETRQKVSVKAIGEGVVQNFGLQPGDIVYVPETFF